ncbi:MAG: hypothetical protein K1X67_07390 [Fimbriimonadaceae bacterium]|nr:hypothetical protein [Fimbriimonadaceae bacterium]
MRWILFCSLAAASAFGQSTTWNLSADWSDTSNPFGPWQLNQSGIVPFTQHWTEWVPGSGQPVWAQAPVPQTAQIPAWGKAVQSGVLGLDVTAGSIFVHGAEFERTGSEYTSVQWTSPITGTVNLHGQVWPPRHIGREMSWFILVDGLSVTQGTFGASNPFSSANRMSLSEGTGGSSVLTVPVVPGTKIELMVQRDPAQESSDFVALYYAISTLANPNTLSVGGTLQDFVGNAGAVPITVTISKLDGAVVREEVVTTNGGAPASIFAALEGTFRVAVKAPHWLRQSQDVTFDETGANLSFDLVNGDSDNDNEVGIGDYAVLSSAYGAEPGDANWDPNADLNGDESVDIGDYAILSANYGKLGD